MGDQGVHSGLGIGLGLGLVVKVRVGHQFLGHLTVHFDQYNVKRGVCTVNRICHANNTSNKNKSWYISDTCHSKWQATNKFHGKRMNGRC